MKRFILAALCLSLTACEQATAYGPCVGIGDDKDPRLVYKVSTQNLIVGILFFEMIAPPVLIAVDEFYCPVGRRP